jgi:hypothetical protein
LDLGGSEWIVAMQLALQSSDEDHFYSVDTEKGVLRDIHRIHGI